MNTRVHYVIVKAATQLLGDMAMDFLNAPINQDNWKKVKEDLGIGEDVLDGLKQETYLDLVMIGAFLEDKPKIKSGISEPKIRDPFVKWAFEQCEPGDYQHWLEHFWNDGLNKDKGLVIDITYICDVIAETLWGKGLGEYFTELTSGIIELIGAPITAICKDGSLVLDSFRSAPARAEEYWAALIKEYKKGDKENAYLKLGRTLHLLADVGTPAHMHGDPHINLHFIKFLLEKLSLDGLIHIDTDNDKGTDDDQYEYYTGNLIQGNLSKLTGSNKYKYEKALPGAWNVDQNDLASYNRDWKLYDYFKELAYISRQYDSDDVDGTCKDKPYHWRHFELTDIWSYDLERQWDGDLTDSACNDIASNLIPASISFSAGLVMHFFDEVGEKIETSEEGFSEFSFVAKKITVHNSTDSVTDEGEIYTEISVNGLNKNTGRVKAKSGQTKNLATDKLNWSFSMNPNENKKIYINSSSEDNDDYWFFGTVKSRDSLGSISKAYTKDQIAEGHSEIYLTSSKGYYSLLFGVDKRVQHEQKTIFVNDAWRKRFGKLNYKFMQRTGYTLFAKQVMYLNLENGVRHMSNKRRLACGHYRKLPKGNKITICLNKDKMFEQAPSGRITALKQFAEHTKSKKIANIARKLEQNEKIKIAIEDKGTILAKMIQINCPKYAEKYKDLNKKNFSQHFSTRCRCCSDERRFL